MSDFDFGIGFKSFAERIVGERESRLKQSGRIMSFGVRFLDAALGGIFPNDLILIGAKPGIGKTALATLIAMANAKRGRTVHYFALEAEENEIERRLKFSLVSEIARSRLTPQLFDQLNYLDWFASHLDHITAPIEIAADKVLAEKFGTLHTFYRTTEFYAEHFEKMVLAIQDQTDLIILDHLHYVDSEDSNENRGYKNIVKKIRDTALSVGKPVVVVAHLRKGERKSTQLIPTLEDFHGTSDVPKIATKAIIIAPAYDWVSDDPCLWPTYFSPVKCRADGSRTRYVGQSKFDARTSTYEDGFDLGRLTNFGETFELVTNTKMPRWARPEAIQ